MKKIERLFDIPYYQLEHHPLKEAIGDRREGKWTYYSTQEMVDLINNVSLGLLRNGVRPGDKIAMISTFNRPEWNILDLGMQQIGVINVPVYPTISPREYAYIFNEAEVKWCFVSDELLVSKIKQVMPMVESLKGYHVMDDIAGEPHWEEILEGGDLGPVKEIMSDIKGEDLATIIYTSGTTGHPKGVMLTHSNIVSNVNDVMPIMPTKSGDKAVSFLPLCHVFERVATYCYMATGVSISYTTTDSADLSGALQAVKPHLFTTVPRLLEKVYEKIYNKGLALTGLKKKLFFWALSLTDDYDFDKSYSGLAALQRSIADRLIFSKWREALGGNIIGIVTGAAACPTKMARVFSAAGIPIREGYGLTETSPALTFNQFKPGKAMLGTVGLPIRSVQIKIEEDAGYEPGEGEILAKGPNIMQGYYKQPEQTAEVMTDTGWLRTGDVGKFVMGPGGQQFLKITDRKKELLKTSGGKYVAPTPIESKLKEDFLIEQAMVVGEGKKFVAALIVPSAAALEDWAKQHNMPWTSLADMINRPEIQEKYNQVIKQINPEFSKIEQIKKFALVPEVWDVSTGELTPTLKLKRRVIMDKYEAVIETLYSDNADE